MIPSQAFGSDIVHESQGGHFFKYIDQTYEMQELHHEEMSHYHHIVALFKDG